MKRLVSLITALIALPVCAQAITYLGLGIDRSGSISASDFTLQINAYASTLADASVLPQDGTVAIGVWSFGETVFEHFAPTVITAGNVASLVAAVNSITQFDPLATALGPVIEAMQVSLLAAAGAGDRTVMDISTDGNGNIGINQVTASSNAILAGIDQINGLGVGGGANLDFVNGAGSFGVQVDSFADFEVALERKIIRETRGVPDTGSTALILIGGLVGLVSLRRRLAA